MTPLSTLGTPLTLPCPEACDLENNILLFADRDDLDLNDSIRRILGLTCISHQSRYAG